VTNPSVGRKITIEKHPFEMVGVAPGEFLYGVEVGRNFDVAVAALCGGRRFAASSAVLNRRGWAWLAYGDGPG